MTLCVLLRKDREVFTCEVMIIKSNNKPKIDLKWGRFLRAPDVYFDKIENNNMLTPLYKTSSVKLGITTGNNSYFYITQKIIKQWKIEDEFVCPLLKGPRDISRYCVNSNDVPKDFCLVISKTKEDLKDTNVFKYIKHGEREGVNLGHFFSNSKPDEWYKITPEYADMVMPYQPNLRHFATIVPRNYVIDKQLVCIIPNDPENKQFLAAYLNSTISMLLKEVLSRTSFGLGSIQTSVTDVQNFPVLNPKKVASEAKKTLAKEFIALKSQKIEDVFKELGCNEPTSFNVKDVRKERRNIDKIVFDLLGFSESEQIDVYTAVIRLVSERVSKAKSQVKKTKGYFPKPSEIASQVFSSLNKELLVRFPEDFLQGIKDKETMSIPGGMGDLLADLDGLYLQIGDNRIRVKNKALGEYLRYSAIYGEREIEIPDRETDILKVIGRYKPIHDRLKSEIASSLQIYSASEGLRSQVEFEIYKKLRKDPLQ